MPVQKQNTGRITKGVKLERYPFMKWYVNEWRSDTAVSALTPLARGIWRELLDAMHEAGRTGQLCGTPDQLSRIARCQVADLTQTLTELQITGAADVTERSRIVTVTNRRMRREYNIRTDNTVRKRRQREKSDVTDSSRGRYQISDIRKRNAKEKDIGEEGLTRGSPEHSLSRLGPFPAWLEMIMPCLETKIDLESFNTWLKPVVCLGILGSEVTLGVPTMFYRNWLINNYHEQIRDCLCANLGREVEIEYRVVESE